MLSKTEKLFSHSLYSVHLKGKDTVACFCIQAPSSRGDNVTQPNIHIYAQYCEISLKSETDFVYGKEREISRGCDRDTEVLFSSAVGSQAFQQPR